MPRRTTGVSFEAGETLRFRARVRVSILTLVTAIVFALSALYIRKVIDSALDDAAARARMVGDAVEACLVDQNHRTFSGQDPFLRHLLSHSLQKDSLISNVLVRDAQR